MDVDGWTIHDGLSGHGVSNHCSAREPFSWEPEGFVLRVQRFAVNLATKVSVFFTSNSSGNSRVDSCYILCSLKQLALSVS